MQLDIAVFIKDADIDYMIVIVVYINNILLIGLSRTAIEMIKKRLKRGYQINNLGPFIIFLRMQVSRVLLTGNIYLF